MSDLKDWGVEMGEVEAPRSLRAATAVRSIDDASDINNSGKKVSAVAELIAVASFSGSAQAQQTNLPPVTVNAPVGRPRPVESNPSPEQVCARSALRRAAPRNAPAIAPLPFPNAGGLPPDRNPYADPAAPYKVDRLQASRNHERVGVHPRQLCIRAAPLGDDDRRGPVVRRPGQRNASYSRI